MIRSKALCIAAVILSLAGCANQSDNPQTATAGSGLTPGFFDFPPQTDQYDSAPVFLKGDAPPYPWPLLAHVPQITGHAILSFTIDENGRAIRPKIVETTHKYFASAVATAMPTWKFKPAMLEGKPVKVEVPRFRFEFGPVTGGQQPRY